MLLLYSRVDWNVYNKVIIYRCYIIRIGTCTAAVFLFVKNSIDRSKKTCRVSQGNTKSSDVFTLFADDVETGADHFAVFCAREWWFACQRGQGRATSHRRSRAHHSRINRRQCPRTHATTGLCKIGVRTEAWVVSVSKQGQLTGTPPERFAQNMPLVHALVMIVTI